MPQQNYLKTYHRISKQVKRLINETESDHDQNNMLIKDHSSTLSLSNITDLISEFDPDIDTDRPLFSTENELEFENNIDVLKRNKSLQTELASLLVDSQCSMQRVCSVF